MPVEELDKIITTILTMLILPPALTNAAREARERWSLSTFSAVFVGGLHLIFLFFAGTITVFMGWLLMSFFESLSYRPGGVMRLLLYIVSIALVVYIYQWLSRLLEQRLATGFLRRTKRTE